MTTTLPHGTDLVELVRVFADNAAHSTICDTFTIDATNPAQLPVSLAILPKDRHIVDLRPHIEKSRLRPQRITETATLLTEQALIDWTRRSASPDSALFCDATRKIIVKKLTDGTEITRPAPRLTSIIDYHSIAESPESGAHAPAIPAWKSHVGIYDFPLSPEFIAWSNMASGKLLDQTELAHFLDDRAADIASPPLNWQMVEADTVDLICSLLNIRDDWGQIGEDVAVTTQEDGDEPLTEHIRIRSKQEKLSAIRFGRSDKIAQLARTLEVNITGKGKTSFNPKTGERELTFEENHQTSSKGAKIIFPDIFLLEIQIFDGGKKHLLPVRFYYRASSNSISFALVLINQEQLLRIAIDETAARIAAATGCPLYTGSVPTGEAGK